VAKKLIDIENFIVNSNKMFPSYLNMVFNSAVTEFIERISSISKVYIFSGVIRNFFLKICENRDIDIVIDEADDIEPLLSKYNYTKNSFGGFKINIANTNIDLWYLKDTWALNNNQMVLDFYLIKYIPNTSFFNFSSIIYDLKEERFYYTKHFLRFLRDKQIEMVFTPNANNTLCIINTFYYSEKYKLKIGKKLKCFIKKNAASNFENTDYIQQKHFGKILYSKDKLVGKIQNL